MNHWKVVETVAFALAVVLAGKMFPSEGLSFGAGVLFGLSGNLIGSEAMITRRIVLGRRSYNESYTELAACAQGIQFSVLGFFLIGASAAAHFNTGDALFQYFVRRPGWALFTFGVVCMMQAIIAILGHQEDKQGSRWMVILNLPVSRLLPGLILLVIGMGALGLGLLDMILPAAFDTLGGGYREELFGH